MTEKVAYVALAGGLDLVTPPTQMAPGSLQFSENFEVALEGGYRPIDGYAIGPTAIPVGSIEQVFMDEPGSVNQRVYAVGTTLKVYRTGDEGASWTDVTGAGVAGAITPPQNPATCQGRIAGAFRTFVVASGIKPVCYTDGAGLVELSSAAVGATSCAVHSNHLFLGFDSGSLQWSAIGDHTDWTALNGAGEIAVGDAIVGLEPTAAGALVVLCKNSIHILYGTSAADFQLKTSSSNAGAVRGTAVSMDLPLFVGDAGLTSLEATQTYSNFASAALSPSTRPAFVSANTGGQQAVACLCRRKSQHRTFFTDGGDTRALYSTVTSKGVFPMPVFLQGVAINAIVSGVDYSGTERTYFADMQHPGRLGRLDVGDSFNGSDIEATLVTACNSFGGPTQVKRFRRVFLEIAAASEASTLGVFPYLEGGSEEFARHASGTIDVAVAPTGGRWGISSWDEFYWSGSITPRISVGLEGSATNFSMLVKCSRNGTPPPILQSYTMHYAPRRIIRG